MTPAATASPGVRRKRYFLFAKRKYPLPTRKKRHRYRLESACNRLLPVVGYCRYPGGNPTAVAVAVRDEMLRKQISVCRRNSDSGDRRRMYRQAPTAFCHGRIGALSFVFVAASASWGALIAAHCPKPFLSGFKRCTFFSRKESTSFAPAAGAKPRVRHRSPQGTESLPPPGHILNTDGYIINKLYK